MQNVEFSRPLKIAFHSCSIFIYGTGQFVLFISILLITRQAPVSMRRIITNQIRQYKQIALES
jgi:hypothetical protein